MLIENDVMNSKEIIVDSQNKIAYIRSCKIIVSIEVRTLDLAITKSIYLRKTTLISLQSKLSMKIHNLAISSDRDFLFELKKISCLIAYAHLIDANTKIVILRNDFDQSI